MNLVIIGLRSIDTVVSPCIPMSYHVVFSCRHTSTLLVNLTYPRVNISIDFYVELCTISSQQIVPTIYTSISDQWKIIPNEILEGMYKIHSH